MTLTPIKTDCPICGSTDGRCREGEDGLIICRNISEASGETPEFKLLGQDKQGNGMFAPPRSQPADPGYPFESLTAEERDRHSRALLAQLHLHPDDRADLKKRGLTDKQIEAGMFRSVKRWQAVNGLPLALPGVLPGDRLNAGDEGYLCAVYDPDGLIVGVQLRLRNPEDGCRYRWLTSKTKKHPDAPQPHLGGQLPITVARPIESTAPKNIGMAEGILKPWIAAQRHRQITIGAAGGLFASSKKHLKAALEALSEEVKSKTIDFYPDSGAIANPHVKRQYQSTWKLLVDWGYQVRIGWWGQFTKAEPDIDEILSLDSVEWLSPAEWLAIATDSSSREESSERIAWNAPESICSTIGSWAEYITKDPEQGEAMRLQSETDELIRFVCLGSNKRGGPEYKFKIFKPKADFDFTVDRVLESEDGGGLVLNVERRRSGRVQTSRVIIPSIALTRNQDFINALKRGLKSNVSCLLKQDELQSFVHVRTEEYYQAGGRTYRLIDRIGQQVDGCWVFEHHQFKLDGSPTTEEESGWVWNPALGEVEKVPSPAIVAPDPEALANLATAAPGFFHPESLPLVWLTCGFAVANLNWQEIVRVEGKFPQLSLYGDPGGGKSTAADLAMSLVGLQGKAVQRFSESVAFEHAKLLSGLPLWLDDPIKKGMRVEERNAVDNFLWSLHNAAARKVRGNQQEPHTAVLATSNVALGEGNAAIESRLLKLYFPVKPTNPKGFQALREAMKRASGGLNQLLSIGYDKTAIDNLESQILEHLHSSHARISQNLALLTYYTQKFCDLARVEFNALQYTITHLCPAADELGSDKDSLSDFLEKLEVLRSQNLIGEWNSTYVTNRDGQEFLALYGPSVWEEFSKHFDVNYSRQTVEKLAMERGAERAPAKFVDSKLTWIEYLKAKAQSELSTSSEVPRQPIRNTLRKALLVPIKLLDEVTQESKLPASYPDGVTSETLAEQGLQTQVTQVTQVTGGEKPTANSDKNEQIITHYSDALKLAAQQNGHSLEALKQLVEEMKPLPDKLRQRVWETLPKDLQTRIQTEVLGKPLKPRRVA